MSVQITTENDKDVPIVSKSNKNSVTTDNSWYIDNMKIAAIKILRGRERENVKTGKYGQAECSVALHWKAGDGSGNVLGDGL